MLVIIHNKFAVYSTYVPGLSLHEETFFLILLKNF
jgi:hypothetical protein